MTAWDFNPRSREGSDKFLDWYSCRFRHFNPRSREGSDGVKSIAVVIKSLFQSSLPRGERLPHSPDQNALHNISILAPARGATKHCEAVEGVSKISILAPARGATKLLNKVLDRYSISILAPARGATTSY